jgi:two-component sensor histidine kinase
MTRIFIQIIRPVALLVVGLLLHNFTCQAQLLQGIAYVHQDEAPSLKKIIATTRSANEKVAALIRLGSLYFHDPYPHERNLASAMQLANEASEISSTAGLIKHYNDARFLIANIYLRKYLPDSAAKILIQVNDSTRLKILLGMSHIYRIIQSEDSEARLKKAMDLTLQAQDISRNIHDTLLSILVRREIACIHSDTQQPNSEKELLEVIRLMQGIGYPYLHYTYYELAGTAMLEGNEDKVLYYEELTLKSMTQSRDSLGVPDWLLAYAMILRITGQHEKSLSFTNQAIQQYASYYGDGNIATAVRYMAEAMVKLHRETEIDEAVTQLYNDFSPFDTRDSLVWFRTLGSVYRLTKQYVKAEPYFKMRIALQKRMHDKPDYYGLGQLYIEARQFVKARPYLDQALKQVDSSYSMRTLAHLHYCMFLADSAAGDYISAIRHLSKNKRYDDTLMKQARVEAIEKYKTQFETEKKEADLKLKDQRINLLTKEQTLRAMDLKRIKFLKNTALIGSLLLLGIGIVFYRLYQRKKKDSNTIARVNEQLKNMLAEKEWWLKEVHHRVKNNLHTIICLLESQAMYLEKDALQAIEKSQHRIYAMSLIHQKLYQNEDLQVIDMSIYLDEFIGYLKDSFDAQKIEFIMQVNPVHLNLQQAIPAALIINEAVTNSIKYAFGNEEGAKIWISMTETNETVKLTIKDNGRGFELSEEDEGKSLGMQLIRGLSKELKGTVLIDSKNGTKLDVVFKKGPLTDKIPSLQEDNIR